MNMVRDATGKTGETWLDFPAPLITLCFVWILCLGAAAAVHSQEDHAPSLQLTLSESFELALENDPSVQMVRIEQEMQLLQMEIELAHRQETRLYQLQVDIIKTTADNQIWNRRMELEQQVTQGYYDLILTHAAYALSQKATAYMQIRYNHAQERLRQGLADQRALQEAHEAYRISRLNEQESQQAYTQAKIAFLLLIRQPISSAIQPTDPLLPQAIPSTVPDLLLSDLSKNRTVALLILEKSFAYERYQFNRNNPMYAETDLEKDRMQVTLETLRYQHAVEEITQNVLNTWQTIETRQAGVQTRTLQLEIAQEHYKQAKQRYDAELLALTALNTVEIEMREAELAYQRAVVALNLAILAYNQLFS